MKKFIFLFVAVCLLGAFHINAQTGGWFWASYGKVKKEGWAGVGQGQSLVAVDNSGNCYFTGFLIKDTVTFGSYTLSDSCSQFYDIVFVKFDPNGNVLWVKQSTQNGNNAEGNGYMASTDAVGNAYFMANFTDTIIFDLDTLTTQFSKIGFFLDDFLVKYDSNGNLLWAKQSELPSLYSLNAAYSLITDRKGNSYITGFFLDTVSFGPKSVIGLINEVGYTFIVKYDANGNVKWAAQSTGYSHYGSQGCCVAVNNKDGIFVMGDFVDSVTFGSYKLTNLYLADQYNVFSVKYDTNGNVLWAKQGILPESTDFAEACGITTDNFGNIYITGLFLDTVIFGVDTLIATNNSIFLVKYDSNGNVVRAIASRVLSTNAENWGPTCLSSDNRGNIYLTGGGGGPGLSQLCFGNDTLTFNDTSNEDFPTFIMKFDSSGKVLCASANSCAGRFWTGLVSDTSGKFVYFGGTVYTIDVFGKDTVNPNNYPVSFPFVARWEPCDDTLTGIQEIKPLPETITLFPDPNNGQFTIDMVGAQNFVPSTIEVYNVLGEKVYNETLRGTQSDKVINLVGQPNGVYFYRVVDGTGESIGSGKLIIQK